MSKNDFKKGISVPIDSKSQKEIIEKFIEEKQTPVLGEVVDGYKGFIKDLGGNFLQLFEIYNKCIEIAKKNEIVGDIKLKARIKDFSSSNTNTENKILDDVFGIEIVAPTEFEKEFFMLFNHLIFKIQNDKIFNKNNGYKAYHCVVDLKQKFPDEIKELMKKIIDEHKANQYRNKTNEAAEEIPVFKNLSKQGESVYNEIENVLGMMIEEIQNNEIDYDNLPLVEFHFLTSEVEENAIRGTASHSNYKKVNEKKIAEFFRDGRLIRGINAPWKFENKDEEIRLQDFYKTLIENWPFLKDEIIAKRQSRRRCRR